MNLLEKYILTEAQIPAEDLVFVNLLRKFLRDEPELNTLELVRENTNLELYHALLQTLDSINSDFLPITSYVKFTDLPSWNILALGATLNILTSVGILSSRNTLTYNDPGGISVKDSDKYGRYINYFNILINKFVASVQNWKYAMNIEGAYGEGQASQYTWEA
jgi:hypothetical protein